MQTTTFDPVHRENELEPEIVDIINKTKFQSGSSSASSSSSQDEDRHEKVKQCTDMGFAHASAMQDLKTAQWNVQAAVALLVQRNHGTPWSLQEETKLKHVDQAFETKYGHAPNQSREHCKRIQRELHPTNRPG
jgi:hypothetical protein